PTNLRLRVNSASCAGSAAERRSTQPTTPRMKSFRSARSSRKRVSSSDCRACTATQPPKPDASSSGFRSPGRESRRSTAISSLIHPYSSASYCQKCWCASIRIMPAVPRCRVAERNASRGNYIARMRSPALCLALTLAALPCCAAAQAGKPPMTLDEYFNTTSIDATALSPDGSSAVIATETPDWKNNSFRHDLWIWSAATGLRPLTHMGSEDSLTWSPDGKWVAFVSDRALPGEDANDDGT